jgi:hypothetical protein
MAIERIDLVGTLTYHRDTTEPKGHLTVVKAVDVTLDCGEREEGLRIRLDYARSKRFGLHVEIGLTQAGIVGSVHSIFKLPSLDSPFGDHEYLDTVARRCGMNRQRFSRLVLKHSPVQFKD